MLDYVRVINFSVIIMGKCTPVRRQRQDIIAGREMIRGVKETMLLDTLFQIHGTAAEKDMPLTVEGFNARTR